MTTVILDPKRSFLFASATNEPGMSDSVFLLLRAEEAGFQFAKFITPQAARLLAHALTVAADRTEARVATLEHDEEL